jgi:hypothetical protein
MKVRTSAVLVGATAITGTGAFLLPAIAAPHAATHTLKFTSITKSQTNFSKSQFGQADVDKSGGKIIGFDTLNIKFIPKTNTGKGNVVVNLKAGFINSTLKISSTGAITGKLTGGTGKFKNVTGTLAATNLNKAGTRTAVTITYH